MITGTLCARLSSCQLSVVSCCIVLLDSKAALSLSLSLCNLEHFIRFISSYL